MDLRRVRDRYYRKDAGCDHSSDYFSDYFSDHFILRGRRSGISPRQRRSYQIPSNDKTTLLDLTEAEEILRKAEIISKEKCGCRKNFGNCNEPLIPYHPSDYPLT